MDEHTLATVIFLILSQFMPSVCVSTSPNFTYCPDSPSNYTHSSPFENNLKHLLESLLLNAPQNDGFYDTSIGNGTDQAYGQALCRGDVSPNACRNCIKNANHEILDACTAKGAIVWLELCQVRYSDRMFFSSMVYTGKYPLSNDQEKNISHPGVHFFEVLKDLMINELSNEAAFNPSKHMFSVGKRKSSSRNETIYGLVQCTRDITGSDCRKCLNMAFGDLDACCEYRQGGSVFSRNCNMRFQLYRFYNESTVDGKKMIWVPTVVTCITALVLASLVGFYVTRIRHRQSKEKQEVSAEEKSQNSLMNELATPTGVVINEEGNLVSSEELPFIELSTIKAATNNFSDSNKLGQGGFGIVYKGVLSDEKEVAVKRLSRKSWQGLEEFKNEVKLLAKLQHKNLVRLVSCGIEREEKLLVYEYMPNKSLDLFIFDSEKRTELDWNLRLTIIRGIARGLLYLHEDSRVRIIHRDLKPNNVLLDQDMVAKISDFGMARIFGESQNMANTKRVVGTYGYMAPEYAMEGLFSVKSDVFSFGVVLLEIISGKRNSGFHLTDHAQTLLVYAWRLWNEGNILEFLDPLLLESCSREEAVRYIHIGLLCVQEDPFDRPNMSSVVVLLGSESTILPEPTQPPISTPRVVLPEISTTNPSLNQVTISSISPR